VLFTAVSCCHYYAISHLSQTANSSARDVKRSSNFRSSNCIFEFFTENFFIKICILRKPFTDRLLCPIFSEPFVENRHHSFDYFQLILYCLWPSMYLTNVCNGRVRNKVLAGCMSSVVDEVTNVATD